MPKDNCILCGVETQYERDVNIEYRNGYIEGAGQMCSHCWDAGTERDSILIPMQMIKDTPNDSELGKKIRLLYWEVIS